MGCLGNVIWFLCGGVISGLSWLLDGVPLVYHNHRNPGGDAVF